MPASSTVACSRDLTGRHMAGLLVPEAAVDVASRQQLFMPSDVLHDAVLENENRVGRDQ